MMLRALSLLLAVSTAIVESRVTFGTSEVLDTDDLKGTKQTATFKCYAGCKVYSPTKNADIVMVDATGKEWGSLLDLSNIKTGTFVELPVSNALYNLKNKGADSPSFVFYAVESGATNYNGKVAYVDAATRFNISPKTDTLITIMSSSGAIRFSNFVGDFKGALPTIHAVPFDSIPAAAACRPVYDAYTASTVLNTDFTVLGPIATINFKTTSDAKSAQVSGETIFLTANGEGKSAVYVSPGYVGCDSTGDSLYTALSNVQGFDSQFSMTDSKGMSLTVDGDYSIEKEADAIELTVNNDVQKLYGKKQYTKIYDETSFKIGVKWAKKEGSKDRFALQIDVLSHADENVQTTTKSGHSLTIISSFMVLVASALMRM